MIGQTGGWDFTATGEHHVPTATAVVRVGAPGVHAPQVFVGGLADDEKIQMIP